MNANNTKATKEAVAKTVLQTNTKAHQQVQRIKDSKIGKYLPVEYEKITVNNIALVSIVFIFFIEVYVLVLYIALCKIVNSNYEFTDKKTGIAMTAIFGLGVVHDFFIYITKNHHFLLSFLTLRILSVLSLILALFMISGDKLPAFFKIFVFLLFTLPCILYTYNFSVFISMLRNQGPKSDPSEHQAV